MRNVIMVLVMGGVFFCPVNVKAEDLTAKIGDITGSASVVKAGQQGSVPAKKGMVLGKGDVVKTGKESFVTVNFLPDSYIELASESELRVTKHGLDPKTSVLNSRIDVLSGHISKANIGDLSKGSTFDIVLSDYLPMSVEGYSEPGQEPSATVTSFYSGLPEGGDMDKFRAVLSNVRGLVEVIRLGTVKAIQAANGMELHIGDIVKTGKNGYAMISFTPDTFVKVADNSEEKIVKNGIEDGNKLKLRLDVLAGHLTEASVNGLPPKSDFEIVLVDYIPMQAEGYTAPEITPVPTPVNFNPASDS